MYIETLEPVSLRALTKTFNAAFADYVVKIQLTESALRFKMRQEHIDLRFSVGVYDQGQLVGFVLTSIGVVGGRKEAYNGGTGVMPAYRGQRSTQKMYEFLIPRLQAEAVEACRLEVIDNNEVAIKVYQQIGFEVVRTFDCQKGMVNPNVQHPKYRIEELKAVPWSELPFFWDALPSWSFSLEANQRIHDELKIVGAFAGKRLIGYAMFLPETGRITQFGVHPKYRRQKVGRCLFAALGRMGNPKMTVINIDKRDQSTLDFLQKIGFSSYIGQYEMTMLINHDT